MGFVERIKSEVEGIEDSQVKYIVESLFSKVEDFDGIYIVWKDRGHEEYRNSIDYMEARIRRYVDVSGIPDNKIYLAAQKILSILNKLSAEDIEEIKVREGEKEFQVIDRNYVITKPSFIIKTKKAIVVGDIVFVQTRIVEEKKVGESEKYAWVPWLIYTVISYDGSIVYTGFEVLNKQKILELEGLADVNIVVNPPKSLVESSLIPMFMSFPTAKKILRYEKAKPLKEIYFEILAALKEYVDLKDEREYHVLACYAIMTHFQHLFSALARLPFIGPVGAGKTRAAMITGSLSYHPIIVTSVTQASLYRFVGEYISTIVIDERSFTSEVEKLIDSGYKRGISVVRMDQERRKFMAIAFSNIYPAIFASAEPKLKPQSLQRSIPIYMPKSVRKEIVNKEVDFDKLKAIREELYHYRMTRVNEFLEGYRKLLAKERKGEIELIARDYEIWKPLFVAALTVDEEIYSKIYGYAKEKVEEQAKEYYEEERLILAAIERIFLEQETITETGKIAETIVFTPSKVQEELKDILVEEEKQFKSEMEFYRRFDVRKIGRILKNKLELKMERTGVARKYSISLKQFLELCTKFGYNPERLKEYLKSQTESEKVKNDVCDVSDVSAEEPPTLSDNQSKERQTETQHETKIVGTPLSLGKNVTNVTNVTSLSEKDRTKLVKEAVLETLREHGDGLKYVMVYHHVAKKLKWVRNPDIEKALEELKAEGKIQEENGLWKLKGLSNA